MSPELCARVADIETVVAIKYSVRDMYARLTRLAGDRLIVRPLEDEWFDNIVELGWQLYLCSSPPYTCSKPGWIGACANYTDLACAARWRAQGSADSLDPVREAFKRSRPAEKFHAHSKYWQELLGQVGGSRAPAPCWGFPCGAGRGDAARLRELRPQGRRPFRRRREPSCRAGDNRGRIAVRCRPRSKHPSIARNQMNAKAWLICQAFIVA